MRVLLVTETLHPGGAEMFVVRLANALCENHEVGVVAFYKDLVVPEIREKLDDRITFYQLDFTALPLLRKLDSLFLKLNIDASGLQTQIVSQLTGVIKQFNPDVVHSHLFKADLVVSRVLKNTTDLFRHVTTIHGDYSAYYNGETDARMIGIKNKINTVVASVDSIVCICEEHKSFFSNQYPNLSDRKLHSIYNGYQPENDTWKMKSRKDLGLPENGLLIGMVSRGVEKKGWQKAIDAFLSAEIPDSTLVLVGEGPYLEQIKGQYNNNPRIIFAGYAAQPLTYIQHLDITLLPTLFPYESLPTVVMEYLYCAKPVIATNVGEIQNMITDPQTGEEAGYLLPFTGETININELAGFMKRLAQDKELRTDLGIIAQKAFDKFNMNTCLAAYNNLYSDIQ